MRLFIAILLPEPIRESLVPLYQACVESGLPVRWVEPEKLHLTLKFLGETPEGRVPAAEEAMVEAAATSGPFTLKLAEVGAFPDLKRPRVLWLGFGESERLLSLQAELEGRLAHRGFAQEDRPYHPHLTLGRVKGRGRFEVLTGLAEKHPPSPEPIPVNAICLMESKLSPAGPSYRVQRRAPLAAEDG